MKEIAYQNKDIMSKALADQFKGKTFSVYGIDVPEIVDVGPTNLPEIEANELRLDNLFRLKDGSFAIIDDKLNSRSSLDDEELMKLIIYPLTFKGKQAKQDAIEQVVEMLDRIEDDDTRRFVAKYLLTFTDKVINRENADKLMLAPT